MGVIINSFKSFGNAYQKAYVRALNDASRTALTQVLGIFRRDYNIKAGDLKKYAKIKRKATFKNPTVTIAYNFSIPLDRFKDVEQTKLGVKAKVKKKKAATTYKGTFLISGKNSGKVIAVKRRTKKRLPVIRLTGLNNLGGLLAPQNENLLNIFVAKYEERYQHHLDYYLGKIKIKM